MRQSVFARITDKPTTNKERNPTVKAFLVPLATLTTLVICAATVNVPTGSTVRLSENSAADNFILAGGLLELDVPANVTQEITGSITGFGEISKTGIGTLIFKKLEKGFAEQF